MTISMYKVSVPIFVQFLTGQSNCIDKTVAHIEAKQLDPNFLFNMRFYPDMYPYSRQVQQATTHAMRCCSALAGAEMPNMPNTEADFAALKARVDKVIDYVKGFKPEPDRRHRGQGHHAQARQQRAQIHRAGAAAQFHPAELLFPLHDRLRPAAPLRRRARQARFHEPAGQSLSTDRPLGAAV